MAKKKKTYRDYLEEIARERNLDTKKELADFESFVKENRPIEAPIRSDLTSENKKRTWLDKGALDDGYDFGDITKTILGTGADFLENASSGILGMGEKAVDTLAYLAPAFNAGQAVQSGGSFDIKTYKQQQEWSKELIEKDLYDEEKLAKKLIAEPAKKIGISTDDSIMGEKADALVQSGGQLLATAATSPFVPWWLTTGITSFGSEAENALSQGASYDAAGGSSLITAGAEILTEKLSGGIKFKGKTLDDVYLKPLTEKITNKTVKALANVGIDAVGEGGEEVLSQVISNLGTSLYKEESIGELIASEEALDGYIESFIGGAVLGGGVSGIRTARESKAEKKAKSMLTENEQSVVDTEVSNRAAEVQKQKTVSDRIKNVIEEQERTFGSLTEAEKKNIEQRVKTQLDSGELDYTKTELSRKELSAIEKEVREDLEKGYIGIDTIESTFASEKTAKIKELEQSLTNITDDAKKAEIEAEISRLKVDRATELTGKFNNDNYLQESYRQEALKKQEFEYEVSDNDSDITKELVESAKNSKMNNTRKMHELFEYTNKIANDTGTKYGFVNNEQLKQLGHDVEGKTVNGLVRVNKDGTSKILINIDSDKGLKTIIGHETTHLLEGTSEYKALQDLVKEYATTKGDYDGRLKQFQDLYKGIDANIENEVTADLVGDYLFTDEQFINNLSTKQPNVFQKVYDFIKHAYKMATAGSKEARQLEQVKRRFDKAYKELSKTTIGKDNSIPTIEADSNMNKNEDVVKFSMSDNDSSIKEQLRKNLETISQMQPVADVTYEDLSHLNRAQIAEHIIEEYDKKFKSGIERQNFGFIELDKKLITGSLKYLYTDGEFATFKVLPQVLKRGKIISGHTDHKGRAVDTITIAAPVVINGTTGYVGAVVKVGGKNKYHVHRILMPDGSEFGFNDNKKTEPTSVGVPIKDDSKRSTISSVTNSVSAEDTKSKTKFSLSTPDSKLKEKQLEVVLNSNPVNDDYHTWIRDIDDIKIFSETLQDSDWAEYVEEGFAPDYTGEMIQEVITKGKITVYSSYPIDDGVFVSPSRMEAESYSGNGKIYSKEVELTDVAWIDPTQGQYARVDTKHSLSDNPNQNIASVNRRDIYGRDVKLQEDVIAPIKETAADPTDIAPVREDLQLSRPLTEEDIPLVEQERDEDFNNLPDYVPEDIEYYNEADTAPIDDAYLRLVAKNMRSELGLKGNQLAGLRKIIQNFSTSDEQNIATLYDAIESEFGTIQEPKKLAEVAEIKEALRTMRIRVSDVIKGDIPDYAKWKQKQFGKIRIANDGLTVDDVYEGLKDVYPGFFPDDIINPTDQLLKIAEVAGMDHKYMEEYLLPEEDLQQVTEYIYEAVTDYKQQKRLDAAREASKAPIDESMIPFEETVLETPIPEDAAPVKKEEETPTEEKEERTLRQEIHKGYMDKIRDAFSKRGYNFDDVLSKAKSKSTFSSVDNTPQRFIEKTLGYKEGQILNDLTTNKTALNESEGIKWLNSFTDRKNGLLAQIAKEYNIKPNSKEDAAAQMYGEGFYLNDAGDLIKYGDVELALDFPDATVRNNIKKLATDPRIRQIYDETLDSINASRKRNGYPEIPRRDNYFLHFRAMEDTFSKLGLPFNPNDIRAKDLPTDLNGMTADLKPGQPYFGSAKQRKGLRTSHSLIGGMERYLGSAKNQIYHIDDIQILRALRNYVADMYGQANGLEGLDALTEEEAEARVKQVYDAHLSNFAKFLNEQANVLAGKTSLTDRGLEGVIGRRGITTLDTINSQVGKNMIGFNVSSSLTNLVSTAQAFAKSNKYDSMKALAQTISNRINSIYGKSDGFVENDPTMIRRKGAQKLSRTPFEKVSDIGYGLMSGIDSISSEFIIRAKYNELTRKGMSDEEAHIEAGKWASRILGDRSLGQQPHLYNSKMLGLFTKFQLEVRNQLDSQFYDTIQEANVSTEQIQNQRQRNAVKAAKITSTFVQLAAFQHLFGKAFESIAGYNPAFDIIGVLIKTLGFDDDEESEDTALDNLEQGFLELLGDLPYTSTLTGGRIPIASALPVEQLITGKDDYGNEKSRWETLAETAPYYVLPGGYNQIKKTTQGLGMFDSDLPVSGSYTDSGNLRFPVEDTPLNRLQAGIFGQWASENAGDYFDNERQPLKEKQIQEYKDLDLPICDYWKYREELKEKKTTEEKFNYITGLDLPVEKKNIMINNVVDRKETVDLINYDDFGSYEEFDFAVKYPEKYTVSKAVGSYGEYKTYMDELKQITADKDSDGKTISGSRKTKVADYINSLDADYGSKLILLKTEYPADDRYNNEIVEYLNNRGDISYDEMVTILTELDFMVDANGSVRW